MRPKFFFISSKILHAVMIQTLFILLIYERISIRKCAFYFNKFLETALTSKFYFYTLIITNWYIKVGNFNKIFKNIKINKNIPLQLRYQIGYILFIVVSLRKSP